MTINERHTTIAVGRLETISGGISVSYTPEHNWIQLFAYDPKDKRKSGVFLALPPADYGKLKHLLLQVEQVATEELERRNGIIRSQSSAPRLELNPVAERISSTHIAVRTSQGTAHISNEVYERLEERVAGGSALIAARDLTTSMQGLNMDIAREIVEKVVQRQRAQGDRT